jgi:hypothetical protein
MSSASANLVCYFTTNQLTLITNTVYHQSNLLSRIRGTDFLQKFADYFRINRSGCPNAHEIMVACLNGAENAVTLPPTFTWHKDPGEDQIIPRKAPNTKLKIICHRIIGEVQRLGNRPVRNAQIMQSHRHQSAMQAGLCRGIIKLFRYRRAILVAQFKSCHATYVIHTFAIIKIYAKNPKILRREV